MIRTDRKNGHKDCSIRLISLFLLGTINLFSVMMIKTGYLISLIVLLGCFPLNVRALQDDLILKRMGVEQGLSNNYVVDITQDNQGCVWIATESGLNKFDGRYFTVYNRNNSQISGNEHNALLSVPQDNTIWIGTQRDGISIFDDRNCYS